jgi:hypothetical protein
MQFSGIIGAVIGAVLGAIIWAVITVLTGYEWAIVAWLVGGLVGFSASFMGSKGSFMGLICALCALGAIYFGKCFAIDYTAEDDLKELAELSFSREVYDEFKFNAEAFSKITSESQYPSFIAYAGYSETENPEEVTQEEIDDFVEYTIPELKKMLEENPDYDTWKQQSTDQLIASVNANYTSADFVIDSLGLFDLLFAFLGVATAFGLGSKGLEQV